MRAKRKRSYKPLLGRRFENYLVVKLLPKRRCLIFCFLCQKMKTKRWGNLHRDRSCGCARRKLLAKSKTIHGHATNGKLSRTLKRYYRMHARCYDPNDGHYHKYGARGVRVCARWRGKLGFVHFLKDMGEVPTPEHSLSRTLDLGNYKPGNVCWGTKEHQYEQARLKRALLSKRKEAKEASKSLPLAA
jgi:hypothetical protein